MSARFTLDQISKMTPSIQAQVMADQERASRALPLAFIGDQHPTPPPLNKTPTLPSKPAPVAIRLTLPFPISANNYWRTRVIVPKSGARAMAVTYVTNEARSYKKAIGLIAAVHVKEAFECEVEMRIKLYRPRKIGDTSNYVKVLEDALEGTCYLNDAQIGFTQTERFDDKMNPRVEVEIAPRP